MPVVLMPVKTRMRVFNPIESDADTGKSGRERNNRCEVYRAARIQAWPAGQIGRFCKRIRSSSAGLRNVEILSVERENVPQRTTTNGGRVPRRTVR